MNFTSQICTTHEQSERLLTLGLKKDTADCVITEDELNSIVATVGAYGGWTHTDYWVSLK